MTSSARQIAHANVAIKGFDKLAWLSSRAAVFRYSGHRAADADFARDDLHQGATAGVQDTTPWFERHQSDALGFRGMVVSMEHFTPISAAFGGTLIGISAALLWLTNGRIAGISGIIGSLWSPRTGDVAWRIAFIIGLVASPVLYAAAGGTIPKITLPASSAVVITAGLLVGFGTRLGGGCTSGHGVCGLARLSPRSLTATALFMTTAIATSFILRHLIGA